MDLGEPINWIISGGIAVVGYFVKIHDKRIERVELSQNDTANNLSDYKLDSERRYAKEETLQNSLARIHDRLDKLPNDIMKIVDRATKTKSNEY